MKKLLIICLMLVCALGITACGQEKQEQAPKAEPATAVFNTSMGDFEVKLATDYAPETSKNFITLAEKGFYNGLVFHRVIDNFMIQGGDPAGNGTGGPGYCIKGEFATNPRNSHVDGALAMARSMDPDSAGSQFYFCLGAQHNLDSGYTVFGTTVEGLDVISQLRAGDEIVHVEIVHE